jgi:hypothetical protein
MDDTERILYNERLSSNKTLGLFAVLCLILGALAVWRVAAVRLDGFAIALFALSAFFLFYVFNYRSLVIRLTPTTLTLKFGVFRWQVPIENIAACSPDHIHGFMYYGGAGIHFMMIDKRYRASFNFLEYPRVLIAFKEKVGPVRDLSFTTQQPEKLIQLIEQLITDNSPDHS